jgi:hypothetical protein
MISRGTKAYAQAPPARLGQKRGVSLSDFQSSDHIISSKLELWRQATQRFTGEETYHDAIFNCRDLAPLGQSKWPL